MDINVIPEVLRLCEIPSQLFKEVAKSFMANLTFALDSLEEILRTEVLLHVSLFSV